MKKLRHTLIGLVLFAGVAAALIFRESPTSDALPSLRSYVTKEKLHYNDPRETYKRWVAWSGESITPEPGEIDPIMIRVSRVENIRFEDLENLVQKDLPATDGWMIHEWPILRTFPMASMLPPEETRETIIATKGGSIVPANRFGGGIGSSDHSITVDPDFENGSSESAFLITETRRLTKWEVAWLKVRTLGRRPYATQEEMSNIEDF